MLLLSIRMVYFSQRNGAHGTACCTMQCLPIGGHTMHAAMCRSCIARVLVLAPRVCVISNTARSA